MLWKDRSHSKKLQRALLKTWNEALEEEGSDLSDEENLKEEAREEILPSLRAIKDICEGVSKSLEPVRVTLDGLSVGIHDV